MRDRAPRNAGEQMRNCGVPAEQGGHRRRIIRCGRKGSSLQRLNRRHALAAGATLGLVLVADRPLRAQSRNVVTRWPPMAASAASWS
jgi:hypothetical protein